MIQFKIKPTTVTIEGVTIQIKSPTLYIADDLQKVIDLFGDNAINHIPSKGEDAELINRVVSYCTDLKDEDIAHVPWSIVIEVLTAIIKESADVFLRALEKAQKNQTTQQSSSA